MYYTNTIFQRCFLMLWIAVPASWVFRQAANALLAHAEHVAAKAAEGGDAGVAVAAKEATHTMRLNDVERRGYERMI